MSSPSEEEMKKNKLWKTYELGPVETAMPPVARAKTGFIPIQIEGYGKGVFTLFEGYGENQKNETSTEDYLKEIQKTAEAREQEGYEKGFAQGEKDGFELGEQKSKKVLENMERLFESMSRLKGGIVKQYEKEILDMIFAIAEKITHIQLGLNHQAVRETIMNAIQYAAEKSDITLRINPDDLNYVEKLRPELFEKFRDLKLIMVNADSTIKKGGCFLETPCGDIDARIETQLEKIAESMKSAFSGSTDE